MPEQTNGRSGEALGSVTDGRPRIARPRPLSRRERRLFIAIGACLLALAVAWSIQREKEAGPRHEGYARMALRRAGFNDVELERRWAMACGRGHRGYVWRSGGYEGSVCSYLFYLPDKGVRIRKRPAPGPRPG